MIRLKLSCVSIALFTVITSNAMADQSPLDKTSNDNVVAVQFGGLNRPTVTIKVCVPKTSQCQLIPNILLDSGSDGLRIFSSILPAGLPRVTDNHANIIAFSNSFAGTATTWGPYAYADVLLGNDLAANMPIQVIDSTFAQLPAGVSNALTSPASFGGLNGVLGIGLGIDSANVPAGMGFYSCQGSGCSPCPVNSHVTSPRDFFTWNTCGEGFPEFPKDLNPVTFTPDNNGWVLKTPSVPQGGISSLGATLILGVGTRNNNSVDPSAQVIPIDSNGFSRVQFQGTTYKTVLDTGTPTWIFPKPMSSILHCAASGSLAQIYCPTAPMNFQATFFGGESFAVPKQSFGFQISNLLSLNGTVSDTIGLDAPLESFADGVFLIGAPFFMGRTVYYGIAGATTPLGSGPFNAF